MKYGQPRTGRSQEEESAQARPIITSALFLVLFLRYLRGEVMDQYLWFRNRNRI